jgi:acid phosphatase
VPKILASSAWRNAGILLITWDEDDGSSANHVLTLVIAAGRKAGNDSAAYDHYSLLATAEDRLHLPRLGAAEGARTMQPVAGTG